MKYRIDSFDFVFLSFDEPNAELCYSKTADLIPWVKRVHGVKGFDSAHLACADASETDFFVTVDGDNIVYPEFLNLEINIEQHQHDHAWTWAGRNSINGLVYGNGGLKLWSKSFVRQMKSHENAVDTKNAVEFCWDARYHDLLGCYSTSYPNGSPQQAWRSGFREGVKMCLNNGAKPTVAEFTERVHHRNLDNLTVWHNIGRDVEHGAWAIAGSRMGTYMTMLTNWDYTQVQWFDSLNELWDTVKAHDPEIVAGRVAEELTTQLDLPMTMIDDKASKFFKHHYRSNWHNQGIMIREIDVIRRQEGW